MHVTDGTVPPICVAWVTDATATTRLNPAGRTAASHDRGRNNMRNTSGGTRMGRLRWTAGLALLAVSASACASGGGSGKTAGEAEAANGVVNMVMAPDAVWKWLESEGIKEEMEQEAQIQVLTSSSWDEFGVFAGGHADVVSAATYEVPDLADAIKEPAAVFGRYNADRSILGVAAGSPYKDLCDLEGKKVATFTAVSITLVWGMYAKEMCGLDLKAGGGDFELVVTDIQNLGDLVARGDADACLCLPDFALPQLVAGTVEPLYEGKGAAQLWAENFGSNSEDITHPQTNVFVAREAWVEKNPKEAAFLLALWERGLKEWQEHGEEIIAAYPEDFGVTSPEEQAFLIDYLNNTYDWYVDSVYLQDQWVDEEKEIFEFMRNTGFMAEDVKDPVFTVVEPTS
jgi:ABC-type nitrate/sulfonate/bicarbonate transport system substrate-binding protein